MSFVHSESITRKLWIGSLPVHIDCKAIQQSLLDSNWDITTLKFNEILGTAIAVCASEKIAARIKCKVASESSKTGWEVCKPTLI
jgi:hypothetical protein